MCAYVFISVVEQTEFRFFWLQTKLEELPEIQSTSKINPVGCCWLKLSGVIIISFKR